MTTDSHCHLNQQDYTKSIADIVKNAQSVGVERILAVACCPTDFEELTQQLKLYPCLYGAFGIHPEYAHETQSLDDLKKYLTQKKVVALGECGLDYHESDATPQQQQKLFNQQIDLAHGLHLPLMIHSRDAEGDMRMILKQAYQSGKLTDGFVLHCFSGSLDMAKEVVQMGGYLSASGVITFKNAERVRAVFAEIPLDRLFVETDAPYLAPHPFRGQPNEPAYVQYTLEKLAEIRGLSVQDMERITDANFRTLYLKEAK